MKFYNPAFKPDISSGLRTDGYYTITEHFGSRSTDGVTFTPTPPKYGFIQFFEDGFCRIAPWNGFYKNPQQIYFQIKTGDAFAFWGLYKTEGNKLDIEYLQNYASPGKGRSEHRQTLKGFIQNDSLVITRASSAKYAYPENKDAISTSSCIGKFVKADLKLTTPENYLKQDIDIYTKP